MNAVDFGPPTRTTIAEGEDAQIGPYRLLRPIGSGGIGRVFAAVHVHLGRRVALKVLAEDAAADPQLVARFLQEGRALEQLGHPGIVGVRDCGKLPDGSAYLAMDHLEGDTLEAWLRKRGTPAPLDTALAITWQIADAMVEVHEKGIVHRDLKPSNIILRPDDKAPLGWRPTIVDFGIAKVPPPATDPAHTHLQTADHSVLGTATYMAPEQCTDAPNVTAQADVYALGTILFELLSGRPPFTSEDQMELVLHQVRTPPPQLLDLVPSLPPLLGTFVASMLAKAPEARPTMGRCRDVLARPWKTGTADCPFPGMQPFSEAQSELFFGRESETRELVSLLEAMRGSEGRRWLQIEGLSGAGKSSLVQAGVLPHLAGRPWIVAVFRPSEDPIRSLARAVAAAYADRGLTKPLSELENALRSDSGSLLGIIAQHHPPSTTFLLVIEQMEELFALGSAHVEQMGKLLSSTLAEPASPVRLLTTLRSDYIHRITQAPELARLLNARAARYHVLPMREEGLSQVILGMASRAGLQLSRELAERMVRDAATAEGCLPLLGHALHTLWSTRTGWELTSEQYDQMGGVGGALARQVTVLFESLGEEGLERAKWLVLDLVQVGRGTPDTRRPRTRGELLTAAGGDAKAEEVLARLAAMPLASRDNPAAQPLRLIVLSGDPDDPSSQRADLIHETLLQQVPIIVAWINAERALLERHADLEAAAHAWERAGSPVDGLPSGSLLDHYRGYTGDTRRHERLLRMSSELARRFLNSAARLELRRLRWRRGLIATLVVAVAATSTSALLARRERERAEERLETFIATTDDIVSGADWKLGRLAHTVDIRRRMLKRIEEDLSSPQYRDQPKARLALVRTKHRLSDLARLHETLSGAGALIDDARGLIEAGLEETPSDPEWRKQLALNLSKRGKIALARGLPGEALADFAESVRVMASMGREDDADDRRTLATSYSEQADAELDLGHLSAAEELYAKAATLLERNLQPDSVYDRALFASTLAQRADVARRRGELRGAAALLERAKQLQEAVAAEQPGNMLYQLHLGRIYTSLAALQSDEGHPSDAASLHALAIAIGEALHRGDPTQKEYGLLLCESLQGAVAATGDSGAPARTQELRDRRCSVAQRFVEQDKSDIRFRRFTCP